MRAMNVFCAMSRCTPPQTLKARPTPPRPASLIWAGCSPKSSKPWALPTPGWTSTAMSMPRCPPPRAMRRPPGLGFIAHMDTAPGTSGENVQPPAARKLRRRRRDPARDRRRHAGQGLPVFGRHEGPDPDHGRRHPTLLGADDKAGVAEIMTMGRAAHRRRPPPRQDLHRRHPRRGGRPGGRSL